MRSPRIVRASSTSAGLGSGVGQLARDDIDPILAHAGPETPPHRALERREKLAIQRHSLIRSGITRQCYCMHDPIIFFYGIISAGDTSDESNGLGGTVAKVSEAVPGLSPAPRVEDSTLTLSARDVVNGGAGWARN